MQIGWNDSKNVRFLDKLLHAIYTYTIVFTLRFLSFFIEDHFYNIHTYILRIEQWNGNGNLVLYSVNSTENAVAKNLCFLAPDLAPWATKWKKNNKFLLFVTNDRKLQEYAFDFKCYVPALILKIWIRIPDQMIRIHNINKINTHDWCQLKACALSQYPL